MSSNFTTWQVDSEREVLREIQVPRCTTFDFSFTSTDSMVPGGLVSYTHVFFMSLRLIDRSGAACGHDRYDVLCSSRSSLHRVWIHLAFLFEFYTSLLRWALHARPLIPSLYKITKIMFNPIVFVQAHVSYCGPLKGNGLLRPQPKLHSLDLSS